MVARNFPIQEIPYARLLQVPDEDDFMTLEEPNSNQLHQLMTPQFGHGFYEAISVMNDPCSSSHTYQTSTQCSSNSNSLMEINVDSTVTTTNRKRKVSNEISDFEEYAMDDPKSVKTHDDNKKFHPYHLVLHQALTPDDFDRRLDHCHWMLNMLSENPAFLSLILWTDEATFTSDGQVNLHNMHYWSPTNPHWMQEVQHQGRWSVNVWCGILRGRIIGPFIFDAALNGETYRNFLNNSLPILLENVPLDIRRDMFFQHDGCPAHFSNIVRQCLNIKFPDRWIGRGSLFPWPPRSPDLTCLDFHLWARLKDLVFATRPTTREHMIQRIRNAIHSIPVAEIECVVSSTRERLALCIENNGGHFEHH